MKNELNTSYSSPGMVFQPPAYVRRTSREASTVWYTAAPLFETALARPRYRFNINGKADGKAERKEIEGK